MSKKVLSIFFNSLAFYPPSINALALLAEEHEVVSYSIGASDEKLNISDKLTLKSVVKKDTKKGKLFTIKHFITFTYQVYLHIKKNKPEVILMYDDYSALVYYLLLPFVKKAQVIWYHNHDVPENKHQSKLGLLYWSAWARNKLMNRIDLFSVPAKERLQYFDINRCKGQVIWIPNYPARWLYDQYSCEPLRKDESLKVIYQGRVSDYHGILELIHYISESNLNVEFTIIGPPTSVFEKEIRELIKIKKLENKVKLLAPVQYLDLLPITASHHVGLAVSTDKSIQYSTGGSASNKLYEHGGLGQPILYHASPHYDKYLGGYEWAFPTDTSIDSFQLLFERIKENYQELSKKAKSDFESELNFEIEFEKILLFLRTLS